MSADRSISAVLILLGGLALTVFGGRLTWPVLLTLDVFLLLTLGWVLGPAVRLCFGPVLYCDVVRTTRRSRNFFMRCGYAAVLLGVLVLLFVSWAESNRRHLSQPGLLTLPPHEMAEFAYSFFSAFLIAQFVLAVLLAPVYAASAITEEKERRTLQFLLTTDLRSHEIILSKLLSRLAQLLLVLLAGLPILGLLQFLGGIDPELLLAAFIATGMMILSLCSMSLLLSVYSQTAWDAVFRAYLFGLLMTAVTALVGSELGKPQYNLGNPLIAWRHLNEAADPSEVLLEVSLGYALFHAALAVVCCMWALLALRRIAQAEAGAAAVAAKPVEEGNWAGDIKRPHRQKPPVTEPALVWKEMNDEPFGWAGRNPFLDSMMVFFAWVVFPIFLLLTMFLGDTPLAAEVVNPMTRLFGTGIMMCTFVLIGLNAAGRFSREVERQTLDNLLTVPDRQGILFAKWWASVLHVRGLWWVLAWLWFLGVLSGGLHVLAVPLLALAALTYSSFVAALGVWLSLVMGSTLRASLATLLAAAGVTLGTWLVAGMASTALQFGPTPLERLADAFQEWGAAAPCTLWVLAIPFAEIRDRAWRAAPAQDLLAGLIGVVYYAGLTALIWSRARLRFRSLLQGTMQTTRAA